MTAYAVVERAQRVGSGYRSLRPGRLVPLRSSSSQRRPKCLILIDLKQSQPATPINRRRSRTVSAQQRHI